MPSDVCSNNYHHYYHWDELIGKKSSKWYVKPNSGKNTNCWGTPAAKWAELRKAAKHFNPVGHMYLQVTKPSAHVNL